MNDLEIKKLRYFIAIAECGSFAAASRRLNVAQPALSQQMANFESDIGAAIFLRSSQGVSLTDTGQLLMQHALAITRRVDQARLDIETAVSSAPSETRIVLPASISQMIGARVFCAMNTDPRSGGITLHDSTGNIEKTLLETREVGIGLTYRSYASARFDSFPILNEDLFLIEPAPCAQAGPVPLADLGQRKMVLPAIPNGMRETIDEVVADAGITLTISSEFNALGTILSAVTAGLGATLLPIGPIAAEVQAGRFVARPIVSPPIVRSLFLTIARDTPIRPQEQRLVRTVLDIIAQMVTSGEWQGATLTFDPAQPPGVPAK